MISGEATLKNASSLPMGFAIVLVAQPQVQPLASPDIGAEVYRNDALPAQAGHRCRSALKPAGVPKPAASP